MQVILPYFVNLVAVRSQVNDQTEKKGCNKQQNNRIKSTGFLHRLDDGTWAACNVSSTMPADLGFISYASK